MCGIVGTVGFFEPGLIERMCAQITHRGPDSEGFTHFPDEGFALGMRRLAVIDLKTGDQPLVDPTGRVHLIFNGEIYNFRELRAELEARGHLFRTRSDTEVVLVAYLEWGEAAWNRLRGMFAIAVLDRRSTHPRLLLVRDHVGMKPLYIVQHNGRLAFASEIKALTAWADWPREINIGAIRDYLALRYVPGPGSLFGAVRKLGPGSCLTYEAGRIEERTWWQPPSPGVSKLDRNEAADLLRETMRRSVRSHLVADVPVGAFLSGGIDSGVLVALMAEAASGPVHTFSIGFPDFDDSDLRRAAVTARAIGTNHHEIECRGSDIALLPDIIWSLDEPIGDAIVLPMYVLAREARRDVTVVLSGEGADEILGGYAFHRRLVQLAAIKRVMPNIAWTTASALLSILPLNLVQRLVDYPGSVGTEGRRKIAALVARAGETPIEAHYREAVSLFDRADILALSDQEELAAAVCNPPGPALANATASGGTALEKLVLAQFPDWLPDDILMKADKMSMAHSLEARIPYMDREVIEVASTIPDRHKLTAFTNKRALRDVARGMLPEEIVRSPKLAFYAPAEIMSASPEAREIFSFALDPKRLHQRGLFSPAGVAAIAAQGREGGFLVGKRLFALVALELWFERFAPEARFDRAVAGRAA